MRNALHKANLGFWWVLRAAVVGALAVMAFLVVARGLRDVLHLGSASAVSITVLLIAGVLFFRLAP